MMGNEKVNLDEVLDKFSIFGKYHLQFMFCAMFGFCYTAMFSLSYIFAAEETGYRCTDKAFVNNTCGTVNGKRCSAWIYDDTESFMAEVRFISVEGLLVKIYKFQLACQEWKRTLVGTVHCFGSMLGVLIVGPLSDRIGRKKTFVLTGIAGAVIGVVKSFSHSYWLFVILEFLMTLLGNNHSLMYVLDIEVVSTKKRVVFHYLCNIGTFIGGLILPLTAWGACYWRNYLRIIFSTGFFFLAYVVLIDESPRWLLSTKKKDKALNIIKKICDNNNVKIHKDVLNRLVVEDERNSVDFGTLLRITIQSRTLLKRCILCIVWWISSTFVYHGMMINSVSQQGNKYVNFGLTQAFLLFGNFLLMYVLHNYKRRNPLICSFFLAASLCFVQPFLPNGHPWLSLTMYMTSSMMSNTFLDITYMYTAELFPTYTRNSMHALCSSIGRIANVLAPQTPLLSAYWSGLPTLIFGCASLVAGLVTFLVPDTADDSLPDTVREAEDIGNKKKPQVTGINSLGMTQELNEF